MNGEKVEKIGIYEFINWRRGERGSGGGKWWEVDKQ